VRETGVGWTIVNIDDFYAANEARRESAEFEFGDEWTDARGNFYELSWVESTGELYVMLGPEGTIHEDLFFGGAMSYGEPVDSLLVQIIGFIATHDEVEARLEGWANAMSTENSMQWLASKFSITPSP
jgi:hypothetical protein